MARTWLLVPVVVIAAVAVGCSAGTGGPPAGDDAGADPDAAPPDAAPAPDADAAVDIDAAPVDYPYADLDEDCAPIFRQSILPEYHLTIAPDHWAAMEYEFLHPQLSASGRPIDPPYHPTQLHIVEGDAEHDPAGVMIRLNGNTSWLQTIVHDDNPKMQFVIAFNKVDSDRRFQGLRKIKLDMPRGDRTFLQQRVALAWLRGRAGVPAQCANNARVYINGEYYGLYSNVESQDKSFLKRIYGSADNDGDLWKGGRHIKTNEETFTWSRISAFWDIAALGGLETWTDLDTSMREWVSEAVIGDCDGYNQGRPNYYLYDRPSNQKFVWLATDLDTSLDEDFLPPHSSPVFATDQGHWDGDGRHYLIALHHPSGIARYVQAMSVQLPKLDPAELEMWIEDWSEQIEDAAAEDPRRPFSMSQHEAALDDMKDYSYARTAYLQDWVDCWSSGGDDGDGDGFDLCHDCNDDNAALHPAAVEVCDEIDNDCDGRVDNVAGTQPSCGTDPQAAAREAFWRRVYIDVKAEADRLRR